MSDTPTPPTDALQATSRSVCSVCRQRKVACDRRRPRCSLCHKNGFVCDYVSTDRRPGLRAGFVSRLEQRLIELEARVKELELKDTPNAAVTSSAAVAGDTAVTSDSDPGPVELTEVGTVPEPSPSTASLAPSARSTRSSASAGAMLVEEATQWTPGMGLEPSDDMSRTVFDPFSLSVMSELCGVWLDKYHVWFPILHQPSLLEDVRTLESVNASDRSVVIKAILSVTMRHCQSCPIEDQTKWSDLLRDLVLIEATKNISLRSIQSLLILSNDDYGAGRMGRFWNLMALCKRQSLQLRLREVVTTKSEHPRAPPIPPPQILSQPNTVVDREERIRAYWMTEMLDSMSTLGASWNAATTRPPPPPDPVLPCSDSLWAFNEQMINVWSLGEFKYSSAFSLCNILVVTELAAVHDFIRQPLSLSVPEQRDAWKGQAQQLDERLTSWREEFVAAVFRLINAEFAQEERAEMDPNIVLTNCLLNTVVIVLFQCLAPYPKGVDRDYEPWAYATNRCVYACENMVAKVRRMSDDEMRMCNPHLVLSIFTAARFYTVYSKALDANIPSDLYSLAYALNMCSQRWELARRYEIIIRVAVAEHKTPAELSPLPLQFYDLRYSVLDLENTLAAWFENLPPGVAAMSGLSLPDGVDMACS